MLNIVTPILQFNNKISETVYPIWNLKGHSSDTWFLMYDTDTDLYVWFSGQWYDDYHNCVQLSFNKYKNNNTIIETVVGMKGIILNQPPGNNMYIDTERVIKTDSNFKAPLSIELPQFGISKDKPFGKALIYFTKAYNHNGGFRFCGRIHLKDTNEFTNILFMSGDDNGWYGNMTNIIYPDRQVSSAGPFDISWGYNISGDSYGFDYIKNIKYTTYSISLKNPANSDYYASPEMERQRYGSIGPDVVKIYKKYFMK